VDGARRESFDGIGDAHLGLERFGVGPAQGVGEVEKQVVGDAPRLRFALVLVELHHQFDELNRERGRAEQNVALARD